jgi:hypothetical protein
VWGDEVRAVDGVTMRVGAGEIVGAMLAAEFAVPVVLVTRDVRCFKAVTLLAASSVEPVRG